MGTVILDQTGGNEGILYSTAYGTIYIYIYTNAAAHLGVLILISI